MAGKTTPASAKLAATSAAIATTAKEAPASSASTSAEDAKPYGAPQVAGEVSGKPSEGEALFSEGAGPVEDRRETLREMLLRGSPEDLAALKEVVTSLPADAFVAPAERQERRPFRVIRELLHDGATFEPEGEEKPQLTRAQFVHLKASGTVEGEWEDGAPADG